MRIKTEQSKSLRKNLPKGYRKTLSKKFNCSEGHIWNVVCGFRDDNLGIIDEAIKLIKEDKNKALQVEKEIKEVCDE
jgi:hypothetical protein